MHLFLNTRPKALGSGTHDARPKHGCQTQGIFAGMVARP